MRLPKPVLGSLIVAAVCLLAPLAGAQPAPPLAPLTLTGDAQRGEQLAYTCRGCHGVPGYQNVYPTYNVPKLGGQNADYLEVALQGYRRGTRSHMTMQAQAAQLSDQDIADVAAYLASIEAPPETGTSAAGMAEITAGQQKSVACQPCHGQAGIAEGPQWPNLAGQHASYLAHALSQYRSGARADLIMGPMIGALDESAIEQLAAYYAALPGLHGTDE